MIPSLPYSVLGSILFLFAVVSTISAYNTGVMSCKKEAFDRGFMIKVITKDDEVIYKWKDSK